jgi:hypothetical protein
MPLQDAVCLSVCLSVCLPKYLNAVHNPLDGSVTATHRKDLLVERHLVSLTAVTARLCLNSVPCACEHTRDCYAIALLSAPPTAASPL